MTHATDLPEGLDERLRSLVDRLDLEAKVALLTGRDFWSTVPIESIGLRSMTLSDGPSGVRGPVWDERSPSLNLPSATALASSWDAAIARRYGAATAREARRKGVDVVLGPTINLHRSPLGGRHFEAFSEDPRLTAVLAAAYVEGVQAHGVAATPKHYVANDFETDRFTVDVKVDERPLREVYLLAFEEAIAQSRAWLVMSAYNAVNGTTATEHDLLETPLNDEWGFDGVVVSDWTAVRSVDSARASQDLVMPGPDGPWGAALVTAVRDGAVEESAIDRKVLRILRLAARVGALDGVDVPPTAVAEPEEDLVAFAREAAVEGTVLLRNDGVLPIAPDVRRIAVIGHNADQARTQGGGSATVIPEHVVSPLDGIRAAFPDAEVDYALGALVQEGIAPFDPASMRNPSTGQAGARVRFLDERGDELYLEDRFASSLVYFGGDAPVARASVVEFATVFTPSRDGVHMLGFGAVGTGRLHVDGELVGELTTELDGGDFAAAFLAPPASTLPVELEAGRAVEVRLELRVDAVPGLGNALSFTVGIEPEASDPALLRDAAVAAARAADVAVVVVGTNARVESEGFDRSDLALPGAQDALVEAVAAANPRTIVLVNSGAPVLLPWRDRVAALAVTYFGGQEYGAAVGDVLTGRREPGGRLPTTWPAVESDVPVLSVTPVDGAMRYDEGIHIGYRAWLRAERTPAFAFGAGMGYTEWTIGDAEAHVDADGVRVRARVSNVGEREGKQVVQVYAARSESAVERPLRWLAGWAVVRAAAGVRSDVEITIPLRAFAHWDAGWQLEPGRFDLHVGASVDAIAATMSVDIA